MPLSTLLVVDGADFLGGCRMAVLLQNLIMSKGKLNGRGALGNVYCNEPRNRGNLCYERCRGLDKLADFGMAKHLSGKIADLSLKGSSY
ncbi:Mitogen-activated protein kinase kinase kinase 5-like protein [Drosera capensis]